MKTTIRANIRQALSLLSREQIEQDSLQACAAVLSLGEYHSARTIMLYLPLSDEIDCLPIARQAWQDGKIVLVPKVDWGEHQMIAVRMDSLAQAKPTGKHGLREVDRSDAWPIEQIDLAIVPGLAFDRKGNRLGRGGGFYDRFLASSNLKAVTCGVAFDCQVLETLPVHAHDRPVDMLATPSGLLRRTV